MGPNLERLLSIAGPPLGPAVSDIAGVANEELVELLRRSNGFFAFESALHVLPSEPAAAGQMTVQLWNDPDLWCGGYGDMSEGLFFFAEDVFGGQFAFREGRVVSFDPETGHVEDLASNLESWAELLLADYEMLTGYPVAHRWQERQSVLPAGKRLLPKRPFVLGGGFEIENLYALDAVNGMGLRAELAVQIKNLPQGASVRFNIIE